MKKITEYALVRHTLNSSSKHFNPEEMTKEVNELIKKGFQPFGAPCHVDDHPASFILQALVKYEA